MSRVIAQIALDRKGGLPENVVTNTMHFEDDSGFGTDGGIETNAPGLLSRLETFYKSPFMQYSSAMNGTGRIKLYNWDTPSPGRIPVVERAFTHPVGTTTMPSEVALTLSFRAAPESGANPRRRRGRVYLGPFATGIMQAGVTPEDARPNTTVIQEMIAGARVMATGGPGAFRLAIYSPTARSFGASADDSWVDANEIWIDNAFDTVRSRGARRTLRFRVYVEGGTVPQGYTTAATPTVFA